MILELVLATAFAAPADDPPPGKKGGKGAEKIAAKAGKLGGKLPEFADLDKNGDGKLVKEEMPGPLGKAFDRIDTDHDGSISKEEFGAARKNLEKIRERLGKGAPGKGLPGKGAAGKGPGEAEMPKPADDNKKPLSPAAAPKGKKGAGEKVAQVAERMKEAFAKMDADGDGFLSKAEARGPLAQRFDDIDANKDGKLSAAEVQAAAAAMMRNGAGAGAGRGPLANFHDQDADGDGRVSKAEAKGALLEKFAELDTNGDGQLTRQEVETGFPAEAPDAPARGKKGKK